MTDFPESLRRRLARPAAIFGEGVSGRSVADSLAAGGFASVTYDERGENRGFGPEEAARHDLLVYSPGFAQTHPWLLAARRAGVHCLTELDFGALGAVSCLMRQPFLLAIVGGVFVVDPVSVILHVAYFRRTGGKRLFLMTPIHHHFQKKGWPATKVVARFWILSLLCGLLGLLSLKLR